MLEAAETGANLSDEQHQQLEPLLRTELVAAQQKLSSANFATIVIISGDDPAGARALLNLFSEWMDARFITTRVFAEPTEEELSHPRAWRYWMQLPPHGRMAVFSDEWTTYLLAAHLRQDLTAAQLDQGLSAVARFERMLAADGTLFVKLFVHLPPEKLDKQREQLTRNADTNDVAQIGKSLLKHPTRTRKLIERMIAATSIAGSQWHLLEGASRRYLEVSAARILLDAMQRHLDRKSTDTPSPAMRPPKVAARSILSTVDLSQSLTDDAYDRRLDALKEELSSLTAKASRKSMSVICAFEGWDAAGKGGTIRRLAQTMDPERYRIVPIAAPTDEEKAHHYLWRFWRHIPRAGSFVIFDRSWYGRVLVERVEGFASESEWQRAYEEITYFEDRLVSSGIILLKFWLHISKDEQLRRFKDRERTPYKQYKIGPEDYRNRKKWDQYISAIDDMVARTSTADAPWHLIANNDKKFGRIQVLDIVAKSLRKRLK